MASFGFTGSESWVIAVARTDGSGEALVRLTETILHRNQVPKLFTANRILFIYSQLLVLLIGCLALPLEFPRPGTDKVAAHEPVPLVNVNK
jgi:hypothetical protein